MHEVLLRHGPQLNEQLHRVLADRPRRHPFNYAASQMQQVRRQSTLENDASPAPETHDNATPVVVDFELQLTSLELSAQLLPSLRTKYALSKAAASGRSGPQSRFQADLLDHRVCFVVHESVPSAGPTIDTFVLPLPYIRVVGRFRQGPSAGSTIGPNPRLVYKAGGYHDVTLTIGPMDHVFSTDLLNQILFAERTFRSELTFLLERLSVERPASALPAAAPIHFNLTVQGEGSAK